MVPHYSLSVRPRSGRNVRIRYDRTEDLMDEMRRKILEDELARLKAEDDVKKTPKPVSKLGSVLHELADALGHLHERIDEAVPGTPVPPEEPADHAGTGEGGTENA
jgi:hypothetical protein